MIDLPRAAQPNQQRISVATPDMTPIEDLVDLMDARYRTARLRRGFPLENQQKKTVDQSVHTYKPS